MRAAALAFALPLALTSAGVAAGKTGVDASADTLQIGAVAPDFGVTTTAGVPFRFSADAMTRPLLLEVFATWCVHCARMAPVISKLYAENRSRLDVIGVSGSPFARDAKSSESTQDVAAWAKKNGAAYPVAFDESGAVAHRYVAHGYPLIVIVGSDGTIASIGSGEIPFEALESQVERLTPQARPDP